MSNAIHLPGSKTVPSMEQFNRLKSWTAVLTSHSTKLTVPGSDRVLISDTLLSPAALRSMAVLHKSVRDNFDKIPLGIRVRPEYFRFNHRRLDEGRLFEYDLNSAYLRALIALDLIDQPLHDRIAGLRKEERLAVVGSLATQKVFIEYTGNTVADKYMTRCPLFPAWEAVVSWVDSKMNDLYSGQKGSLFYWVDALFLETPARIPDSKRKVVYYKKAGRFVELNDGRKFPILNNKED